LISGCRSGGGEKEAEALAAEEAAEEGEGVAVLLRAGAQDGHQDRLGLGAGLGAVSAPNLAVDHGGTDGLLGAPVGRVQTRMLQEGQQLLAVVI
jgi:hypothetical protein